MSSPQPYTHVSDRADLKQILDAFIALWMRDPDLDGYTHVRAEFNITHSGVSSVDWKLLEADDSSIHRRKSILMGDLSSYAVERCVRPFYQPGAERGQLTFRFSPPAVMLDLFDAANSTVVAEFIIDGGKLS